MRKFPILKSNSLDQQNEKSTSKTSNNDKFKVINDILRDKKEICKSVDQLFTHTNDVFHNKKETPSSSTKANFFQASTSSQQGKRNSRSEENLVDNIGGIECFSFNLKTKSISSNEFNKV